MSKKRTKKDETIEEKIVRMYEDDGKSLREIAKEVGWYANKVMKLLKSLNKLRSKSEAQKLALELNKTPHPTKNKKIPEDTKLKISQSVSLAWQNLDEETKQEHAERSRKNMKKRSKADLADMRAKAQKGLEKARKEGSKMEHFVRDSLIEQGYRVDFHRTHLLQAEKLEIDIFLPQLGIAVEIDGPFHHRDDWGEKRYESAQRQDNKKNALLLASDFSIIRVKYDKNEPTLKYCNDLMRELVDTIERIKNEPAQVVRLDIE